MEGYSELFGIIRRNERIAIYGHCLPDGDCYGCQIGLRDILRLAFPEKKIFAIGSGIPQFSHYFGEMDEPSEEDLRGSLAIIVDVSCLRRVERKEVYLSGEFIKFDHHTPNREGEEFPFPCVLEPERVSCAEIIADFALFNKLEIPASAASALYLGMVTDSGKFAFFGTNRHTLELAHILINKGADPKGILDLAFFEPNEVKALKRFIKRKAKRKNGVVYCYLKPEDYEQFGVLFQKAGDLVNVLGEKGKSIAYALFTQSRTGHVRIELRSNSMHCVQPIAVSFGGGGHRFAAGIDYDDPSCCDVEAIVEALSRAELYNGKDE